MKRASLQALSSVNAILGHKEAREQTLLRRFRCC